MGAPYLDNAAQYLLSGEHDWAGPIPWYLVFAGDILHDIENASIYGAPTYDRAISLARTLSRTKHLYFYIYQRSTAKSRKPKHLATYWAGDVLATF